MRSPVNREDANTSSELAAECVDAVNRIREELLALPVLLLRGGEEIMDSFRLSLLGVVDSLALSLDSAAFPACKLHNSINTFHFANEKSCACR